MSSVQNQSAGCWVRQSSLVLICYGLRMLCKVPETEGGHVVPLLLLYPRPWYCDVMLERLSMLSKASYRVTGSLLRHKSFKSKGKIVGTRRV